MDYQLDESLGSEKASEKVLNKNLIKEFCVEKIAKTLPYYEKSENSKSTDDYYNNNQNNIITNRDLVKINDYEISDQNFDLIRIVKKECIDIKRDKMLSPVFSCLNIKRIAMNFNKFNSPILIKQEREKESYFDIEKEGNSQEKIIQTVEKKEEIKSRKIIKKPIFLGSLQFEISAYQRFEFFMRSINFSNNITINPTKLPCVYKVYVGKGNNQTLIRKLMKNRYFLFGFLNYH